MNVNRCYYSCKFTRPLPRATPILNIIFNIFCTSFNVVPAQKPNIFCADQQLMRTKAQIQCISDKLRYLITAQLQSKQANLQASYPAPILPCTHLPRTYFHAPTSMPHNRLQHNQNTTPTQMPSSSTRAYHPLYAACQAGTSPAIIQVGHVLWNAGV